jgi:hypothetical protein
LRFAWPPLSALDGATHGRQNGAGRDLAVGTAQVIPEDALPEKRRTAAREGRPLRIKHRGRS